MRNQSALARRPSYVSVPALIASIVVSLVSPSAFATDGPRTVSLLTSPARTKDAAQVALIDQLLQAQLESRDAKRVRHSPLFDPTALTDAREQLEAARREMGKDHTLARAAEHEGAFNRALLSFRGALASAELQELAEVHIAMATTRLKGDDRRLAADYLATAMLLRPALKDSDFMGQNTTRDLFRELKSDWSSRGKGSIKVTSKVKGAEVYRNDELVGYTPLTLSDLPAGSHLIRVKRDGYYGFGRFVTVRDGSTAELLADVRPVPGRSKIDKAIKLLTKSRWPKDTDRIARAIQDIRSVLGTQDVVILTIARTRKGFKLSGAAAVNGMPAQQIKTTLAADAQLLDSVKSLVQGWFGF